MGDRGAKPAAGSRLEEKGPPCRRCGNTSWRVETRPKSALRWAIELAVSAPDVILFHGETTSWPSRQAEFWTCQNCGRRVRV